MINAVCSARAARCRRDFTFPADSAESFASYWGTEVACFMRIDAEDGARHYVNLDLVEDVVEHVDGTLWIRLDEKYGIRLAKNSPDGAALLDFLEGRATDEGLR